MSGPRLRMQVHGCSCEYTINRHSMAEKVLCHGNKLSIRLTPAWKMRYVMRRKKDCASAQIMKILSREHGSVALAPQLLNTVMMTDNGAQDMLEVRDCGETRTRMRHPAWIFSIAMVA